MPNALITGITGQDGSYLAELLLDKGYDVYGLVRRSSTDGGERLAHIADDLTLLTGDLLDEGSLVEALRTSQADEVYNLNEVECVNGMVWANIWQTEFIARIDPATGVVTGLVDAIALDAPTEPESAVLNGIAWDASTQSFYVTGKLWPNMYRVNFVPAPTG